LKRISKKQSKKKERKIRFLTALFPLSEACFLRLPFELRAGCVLALIFRLSNFVKNCHFLSNFVKYCINLQTIQASPTKNNPNHKEKNSAKKRKSQHAPTSTVSSIVLQMTF